MTPEQEFERVVALAKLHPEDVTAAIARHIEELLKLHTPDAAAFYLRAYLGWR